MINFCSTNTQIIDTAPIKSENMMPIMESAINECDEENEEIILNTIKSEITFPSHNITIPLNTNLK